MSVNRGDAFAECARTEVDGLLERGIREQARSVRDTTARRDDLPSTTVNGIGVKIIRDTSAISIQGDIPRY